MAKHSHRNTILEAGRKVMFRKGYIGAGVRDIVAEAGVPQGSFTNHFRSKEEFTKEVLDLYFRDLQCAIETALGDVRLRPRQRIEKYLDIITGRLAADGFSRGCLIGDLSLEAAPQSEMLRYATDLRSMTQGRGTYSMELSHYDPVPSHLQQKIIEEHKKELAHVE